MGGYEKPLAGSGVPSPAPHKEVLTLSEHVLARKDFFFFCPKKRCREGVLKKGTPAHTS